MFLFVCAAYSVLRYTGIGSNILAPFPSEQNHGMIRLSALCVGVWALLDLCPVVEYTD